MARELTPAEYGEWRRHFRRFPPDGCERLLALLVRLQCADPLPHDAELRPWAYPPGAGEAARVADDEAARERRALAAAQALGDPRGALG